MPTNGQERSTYMAYVPVPKDLTKVKTKVALNLTKRQLIFFSLAAVAGIPFYLFMRKPIGSSIAAILMVTIMLTSAFGVISGTDVIFPFLAGSFAFNWCKAAATVFTEQATAKRIRNL